MTQPASGPIRLYTENWGAQTSMGNLNGELCGGNPRAGQQISMSQYYYTQSGTQQGPKITAAGYANVGNTHFGQNVTISSDGNTMAAGAWGVSGGGGAFVYTRTGNTWTSQSGRLLGTGGTAGALQGVSVALSADGNTLASGGSYSNINVGGTWVFVRNGSSWIQQSPRLIATPLYTYGHQGSAVALSADGNTLASGANLPVTLGFPGALVIYTRSGTTWSQQGNALVGTGNVGGSTQGTSVALSADGNLAVTGGPADNSNAGAVWTYKRTGNTWSQVGSKLTVSDNIGPANFGQSVALSADGNTLAVGGYTDNSSAGAVWIFTNNGNSWTQQSKITATGNTGAAALGQCVSLTADGNDLATGGSNNAGNVGSTWTFTRNVNTWSQQLKITGNDVVGNALQGFSVAFSKSGSTLAVGGWQDNSTGAVYIFV